MVVSVCFSPGPRYKAIKMGGGKKKKRKKKKKKVQTKQNKTKKKKKRKEKEKKNVIYVFFFSQCEGLNKVKSSNTRHARAILSCLWVGDKAKSVNQQIAHIVSTIFFRLCWGN